MFTVGGVTYTLKYNIQKVKTIEMVTKTSIIADLAKGNGVLPFQTLETAFTHGLVEEVTNTAVKPSESIKMFEKVLEENGFITVNTAIVEKLQSDLGFMFR